MNKIIRGKTKKYGDNINTDIISPPAYMELPIKDAAKYSMSPIDIDFAANVARGDIFVAGNNMGSGSSRETAPLILKELGINVIIAKSFARIFYRNCMNVGIVALECPDTDKITMGDSLEINLGDGTIKNITKNEQYNCSKIPNHLLNMVSCGGLVEYIKNKKAVDMNKEA
ncbi:MAG: 3-isopropylmalate dehydratase small subunit [Lentihominibacter sp.]